MSLQYACYMFPSKLSYNILLNLYLKLSCMFPSITKKGEIESTFAPLVVLVINVNIHVVGLTPLSSTFQISSTLAWQGHEDVDPFKMIRIYVDQVSRLYIFI